VVSVLKEWSWYHIGGVILKRFYPDGGVVDSLSCTILGSATKYLQESDLFVTQPSNNFGR